MSRKRKEPTSNSNILAQHAHKIKYFEDLYNSIPQLEIELDELKLKLRKEQDDMRKQQVAASNVRRLTGEIKKLTTKKTTKAWVKKYKCDVENEEVIAECPNPEIITLMKEWDLAENIRSELDTSYRDASALEVEIKKAERNLMKVSSRDEEYKYMFQSHAEIMNCHKIREMTRTGLGQLIEQNATIPVDEQFSYKTKSIVPVIGVAGEITVRYVSKTGRNLFTTTDKFSPMATVSQIMSLYCFKLRDICGDDIVAERLIQETASVYLTKYHLLLPSKCKNLDQVMVHYSINPHQELLIWVNTDNTMSQYDSYEDSKMVQGVKRHNNGSRLVNYGKETKEIRTVNFCHTCEVFLIRDEVNGAIVCPKCAVIYDSHVIAEGLKGVPFSHQMTISSSKSDYKPIMHLNDILKQEQAIESLFVPEEVLDTLDQERMKHRKEPNQITFWLVKSWLKKLARGDREKNVNYTRYYNNIPQIIARLGGKEPVRYSELDERDIRSLFIKLIEPFRIFCPTVGLHKRQNLLSYNFILRQIFLIKADRAKSEDEQKFWLKEAERRPIIQDPKKLAFYNSIWKKMTLLAHLPYFPVTY